MDACGQHFNAIVKLDEQGNFVPIAHAADALDKHAQKHPEFRQYLNGLGLIPDKLAEYAQAGRQLRAREAFNSSQTPARLEGPLAPEEHRETKRVEAPRQGLGENAGVVWIGYEVKAGDSLSAIASRYPGVPWRDLAFFNGLEDPNLIRAGQILIIPTRGGTGAGELAISGEMSISRSGEMIVFIPSLGWNLREQEALHGYTDQIISFFENTFGPPKHVGTITIFEKRQDPVAEEVYWDAYTHMDGRVFIDRGRFESPHQIIYSLACEIAHYWGYPDLKGFRDGFGNSIAAGLADKDEELMALLVADTIAGKPCETGYCTRYVSHHIFERYPDFFLRVRDWYEEHGYPEMSQEDWLDLAESLYPGFRHWWDNLDL